MMKIFAAPLQGLTDAPMRHFHATTYGGVDSYFTPFVRIEKGEVRRRDAADISSPLNKSTNTVPQVIFRDRNELVQLLDAVERAGHRQADLNLGCPFPPQVKRGRGAGILGHPDVLAEAAAELRERPHMSFSIKMRPGIERNDQWKALAPIINEMDLSHVTIHPRTASQGYGGETDKACFDEMRTILRHHIIYNGDIMTPDDIDRWSKDEVAGVMIGRGLLARPSVAEEWRTGETWPLQQRIEKLVALHTKLMQHYSATLCGETQILSKLLPYWEYSDKDFPPRMLKQLRKSRNMAAYRTALERLISAGIE